MRATLDQLVADQPHLERKQRDAEFVLGDCRAWLDGLPDNAALEFAPSCKPGDDLDLGDARQRIDDAMDEIRQLRAVPTPGVDIRERIEAYMNGLARPRISGIASGQQLRVDWPSNMIAVMALLLPEQMMKALLQEIEHHSNTPMSLPERMKRIAELEAQVDTLQRRALALGADLCVMPAQVILGVRATRPTKRAA